jgi:predicted PurR-regulated permease PerM
MVTKRSTTIFLVASLTVALYFCYTIFRPFLSPLLSAVVLAIVFFPIQARVLKLVRNASLAALISTLLVIIVLVVPGLLIGLAITREVTAIYNLLDQKSTQSGGLSPYLMQVIDRPLQWLGQYVDLSNVDLRKEVLSRLQSVGGFLLSEVGFVAGKLGSFALNSVITFFTLFFLFREGKTVLRRARVILPLSPAQSDHLIGGIAGTIMATVYGGLVVAAVQGTLVGLALWFFGVPSPVLWGVVAAVFALLPVVGTTVVWIPAALYLAFTGHWVQGLLLAGWGAFVVGTVDNIIRPYFISGQVQMHTLLIFFACLGGVSVFGFLGLFVGPVVLAVTLTLLRMIRDEGLTWTPAVAAQPSAAQKPEG